MNRFASPWLLVCFALLLMGTGCSQVDRLQEVQQQSARAAKELHHALGVEPFIEVNLSSKDDLEFVRVNVRVPSAPQGMSAEEVQQKVNIILRKHIPNVTQVTVTF